MMLCCEPLSETQLMVVTIRVIVVELRETASSADSCPVFNAENALKTRLKSCSLAPVSLRSVIVVKLREARDSTYPNLTFNAKYAFKARLR
ncbi:hypothetical protein LPAF129_02360 [Ligilactobacillus pabuli]|uniref:Uncharacterized protein n=1 Tax=Ligilactobacillus pabuli TaxID=2886039 RepID=A0ABQ5JFD2_9LACO|nr:hypothetical protein LPAF129_02360 [Ligilactobacillus pabuli]